MQIGVWRCRLWVVVAILVALLGGHEAEASPALRSPWDAAVAVHSSAAARTCPSPPTLPADIDAGDYYSDSAHSVVGPARQRAYEQSTCAWHNAARTVDAMADQYRTDGDASMAG